MLHECTKLVAPLRHTGVPWKPRRRCKSAIRGHPVTSLIRVRHLLVGAAVGRPRPGLTATVHNSLPQWHRSCRIVAPISCSGAGRVSVLRAGVNIVFIAAHGTAAGHYAESRLPQLVVGPAQPLNFNGSCATRQPAGARVCCNGTLVLNQHQQQRGRPQGWAGFRRGCGAIYAASLLHPALHNHRPAHTPHYTGTMSDQPH
jgi:hypothetical protein